MYLILISGVRIHGYKDMTAKDPKYMKIIKKILSIPSLSNVALDFGENPQNAKLMTQNNLS